jgi:hypothetical protein
METAMRECLFARKEGKKERREGRKRRIYPRIGNGNGNGLVRYTCTFGDFFWHGARALLGDREVKKCVCVCVL